MPSQPPRPYKAVPKAGTTHISLPKAWPPAIIYLTAPKYSPTIDHGLLLHHHPQVPNEQIPSSLLPPPQLPTMTLSQSQSPCPLVRIKPITNPSHPAHTQHGLFAAQPLAPSTFILSYLGYVHSTANPTDPDQPPTEPSKSDYDLTLDASLGLAVDAAHMGNEARFINDYRGVPGAGASSGPNAEFRDVLVDVSGKPGLLERRVGVFVLSAGKAKAKRRAKGIARGEEILVSYGKGFWRERNT